MTIITLYAFSPAGRSHHSISMPEEGAAGNANVTMLR